MRVPLIAALIASMISARNAATAEEFAQSYETIFVLELARHGARSHEWMKSSPVPSDYFGPGVGPGYVTDLGRIQHLRNGLDRRREYVVAKGLLSPEYNPNEILSMSTFKQRCVVSGEHMV